MPERTTTLATTRGIDLRDRVAYWEDYNTRNLVGLRCMLYHDDGLEAEQFNVDLGEVKVASITGNAHVIDRTSTHIEGTPKDSVFITHLVAGSAFFLHSQGSIRLGPGDTIMYDPSKPYLFGFDSAMEKVLLDIPRTTLTGLSPVDFPVVRPRGDRESQARSTTLLQHIRSALDEDPERLPSAPNLVDAAVALMWPGEAAGSAVCTAAKQVIHDHLSDLGLTVEGVARAVGVSPRHLNRLFVATDGHTVTQYVQLQRLQAAHDELSAPSYAHVTVADIAARWGFSSQSHLTRSFGRHFGYPPREARRSSAAG